ncbi:hypothetical protein BJX64DRAFT_249309 [Aspergillus heterothallicus]
MRFKAAVELASLILMFSAYVLYHEARLVPYGWKRRIVNAVRVSRARKLKRGAASSPILKSAHDGYLPSDRVGFHHLPLEIQQQIFDLVLPPRLIFQPELRDSRLVSRIGTFPNQYWNRWDKKKHIRDDTDPPSENFARVLGDGGWYLDQTPEPLDPSAPRPEKYLICGYAETVTPAQTADVIPVSYLNFLRVDRRCYATVLDDLYSRHTISLFGPEMLMLFMNNSSLEGMERIQYIHLGIPLPKPSTSAHTAARKAAAAAISRMAVAFPGLKELDVELALLGDPRAEDVTDLSKWIFGDAFSTLRGLKKFVLKVSVLKRIVEMRIGRDVLRPTLVPLRVLSDRDYAALGKKVTEKPASCI